MPKRTDIQSILILGVVESLSVRLVSLTTQARKRVKPCEKRVTALFWLTQTLPPS